MFINDLLLFFSVVNGRGRAIKTKSQKDSLPLCRISGSDPESNSLRYPRHMTTMLTLPWTSQFTT